MAFLKLKADAARLRTDAVANASGVLIQSSSRLVKIDPPAGQGWLHVRVVEGAGEGREGYIQDTLVEEATPVQFDSAIDLDAFFDDVTHAARGYGAPRDYLWAVASLESGLRNIQAERSSAFGPFQFLPDTWGDLVKSDGKTTGIFASDITAPWAQAIFAAIFTAKNLAAATNTLGRVPSNAELFLLHLLGTTGGATALKGKGSEPIRASGPAIVNNPGILTTNARLNTLDEAISQVVARLLPGFQDAARRAAFEPALQSPANGPGEPAWLGKARAELAKGIKEDQRPGQSNPDIEKYFEATTFGHTTDDTAWCAAFMAWCVATCDDPPMAATAIHSASAADWLLWGSDAYPPRIGSAAITEPSRGAPPGHVGFVVGATADTITLLSGNWGNAVAIDNIPRSTVVRFRDPRGGA